MKRILITGGTGFFGKSILGYFARNACDCEFTILSRHGFKSETAGGESRSTEEGNHHCPPPPTFYFLNRLPKQLLGDVRTFDVGSARFDWVIHAATPARVDVPDDEMRSIIVDGTANALKQAKKCGAEKFMMVSSGGVYGTGRTRPVSEDDEPHPYTAYGIAKLEAEKMAIDSGLHVLLPRCFAFVGPYLDRAAHFAIGNFIRDALAGQDIVINGDGTPMRSYLYADDLVEWLFAILERGESGRVYNVGSPEAVSIRDLAQTVLDTVGMARRSRNEVEVDNGGLTSAEGENQTISNQTIRVLGAPVPGAANYYVPNVDRIARELGVRVKVGLREAILRSCGKCPERETCC